MPRIRRWHTMNLYQSDSSNRYSKINMLFSGTVNWALIHEHYPQFMKLVLAIQSGTFAPSAVLTKVNSYKTKNRFALALKEPGNAVRTTYLLEWNMDESLRRTVHKGTTKIELHHKFSKHLAFGSGGHLRSNNPADQENAIVYNELVTNAVALQNVVDQTQALYMLASKPKMIMLDEPSEGIMPKLVDEMFECFELLKKNGVTLLLMEQSVEHALRISDRAYIMAQGEIVHSAAAQDLLNDTEFQERYCSV